MSDELTPLQQEERKAMCGDRNAVMRIVSALRAYREASQNLLRAESPSLNQFEAAVEEIERDDA